MSSSAPHDTVAANRLDPNVSADGHLSSGPGVGGQSTDKVHDEGLEHIKGQLDERGAPLGGTHTTTSAAAPTQPAASNPGVEDATGEQPQTIVGTIKNYLGLSGTEARHAEDVTPAHQSSATTSDYNNNTTTSSTSGSYIGAASSAAAGAGAAAASALGYDEASKNKENQGTTTTLPDRTKETSNTTNTSGTSNVADSSFDDTKKSASASGGVANPSVDSSVPGTSHPADTDGVAEEAGAAGEENKKDIKPAADPSKQEHRDAIPTAGGQKLGEKHWGESKIVPDNPKPQQSEAGVASSEGQPTSEVKDNTSKNTGGATGGPQHGHDHGHGHGDSTEDTSGGKEKLTDKIKDKLHIGKK